MSYTTKLVLTFVLSGVIVSAAIYLYGAYGPFYRTEPLILPLSFSSNSVYQAEFDVDRSEEYMVEVHLKRVFSDVGMKEILGDFVAGGGGLIDVAWEIKTDRKQIAQGSTKEFGYSPIFGRDHWGLALGSFRAEVGKSYTLQVTARSINPEWNQAKPYVEVGLHPAKLEGYLVLQTVGFISFVVFSVLMVSVTLWQVIRYKKRLAN